MHRKQELNAKLARVDFVYNMHAICPLVSRRMQPRINPHILHQTCSATFSGRAVRYWEHLGGELFALGAECLVGRHDVAQRAHVGKVGQAFARNAPARSGWDLSARAHL